MKEVIEKFLSPSLLIAILLIVLFKNDPQAVDTIKLIIKAQDELNKQTTVQVTVNDSVKLDSIKVDSVKLDSVKVDTTK